MFERLYSIEEFNEHIYNERYVLITARRGDYRSSYLINKAKWKFIVYVDYTVSQVDNRRIQDTFTTTINSDISGEHVYNSLQKGISDFIQDTLKQSNEIVIDISGLHMRFLAALLAQMTEFTLKSLYCAYSEPKNYVKKSEQCLCYTNEYSGRFELFDSFLGYYPIPGLSKDESDLSEYIWVVFLGFEGARSYALQQEKTDANATVPVITVPATHPGWGNHAFDANQHLFEEANLACSDIEFVPATDPFATYDFLLKQQEKHQQKRLVVSPLSTRAIALGAILYSINISSCEIAFDTPKEAASKIETDTEVAVAKRKINLYDVLSYINKEEGLGRIY